MIRPLFFIHNTKSAILNAITFKIALYFYVLIFKYSNAL